MAPHVYSSPPLVDREGCGGCWLHMYTALHRLWTGRDVVAAGSTCIQLSTACGQGGMWWLLAPHVYSSPPLVDREGCGGCWLHMYTALHRLWTGKDVVAAGSTCIQLSTACGQGGMWWLLTPHVYSSPPLVDREGCGG